jgi:zinc D-Ala-D-Ala carboxypeptidase
MILSKHVTIEEFERSSTAVKHGIFNKMGFTEKEAAILLCENVFEPIREHIKRPINISSGFRSLRVNSRIGGAVSSQHVKGEAMDVDLHDKELFDWIIENVVFDQMIAEFPINGKASWFHISYKKGRNRKQALIAVKKNGKTSYLPYEENSNLLF